MKTVNKVVIGIAAVMGLGFALAHAQPAQMATGMGSGIIRGQMMHGQMLGQNTDMKIMRELMTPSERLAMMDKMIDAKSIEERQAIMNNNHAEMEKRAKEKGITLPANHYPKMISGRNCG